MEASCPQSEGSRPSLNPAVVWFPKSLPAFSFPRESLGLICMNWTGNVHRKECQSRMLGRSTGLPKTVESGIICRRPTKQPVVHGRALSTGEDPGKPLGEAGGFVAEGFLYLLKWCHAPYRLLDILIFYSEPVAPHQWWHLWKWERTNTRQYWNVAYFRISR